jgi:hypothetical protein
MIERPTRVEASRSLADEKPSANGSQYPILDVRRVPACRVARIGRIMRRIQTRDLRSKRGVFRLCGAPACFPVISQGEASDDPGNQDNS